MAHESSFKPGMMIGSYEIVRLAGSGGMGEVYLANDTRLHRKVALKVLAIDHQRPVDVRMRLQQEAQALASVSHPNIGSIYDLVEIDNRLVMVMEWIEGKLLSSIVGSVSQDQLQSIAVDVAAALSAAHHAGICHGDIKPSNIIRGDDGRTRVFDFGIARTFADSLSYADYSGTISYMAPELISGNAPSPQSDQFSLGVLLYELATGTKPFSGDYEAVVQYQILNLTPAPITTLRSDLPQFLIDTINQLLEKNPDQRFGDTSEICAALGQQTAEPASGLLWRRSVRVALSAIIAVIILSAGTAIVRYGGHEETDDSERRTIAVLPFENTGGPSQGYFADGMTDAIIAGLAQDTAVSVISRQSVMNYRGSSKTIQEIGRELAVAFILTGGIQRSANTNGDNLRISANLADVRTGRMRWAKVYDRNLNGLFAVQNELAVDVKKALHLSDTTGRNLPPPTFSLSAYDFFLRGNDYFNRGWSHEDIRFAIGMYENAVAEDSSFAMAYAMLARCHASMFWEYFDRTDSRCLRARQAADRAMTLKSDLPEAYLALGYYYYHCELDYIRALEQFYIALRLDPNNCELLNAIAAVERRQGNLPMALEHFKQSQKIDPRSHLKAFEVGLTYGLMRQYSDAHIYLDRAITLCPDWSLAYIYKAWLSILEDGDIEAARGTLAKAPPEANLQRSHYYWWLQRIVQPNVSPEMTHIPVMDDTAAYYLFLSQINRLRSNSYMRRAYADSARNWIAPRLATAPNAARYNSYLGLAYAELGEKEKGVQFGQKALELLPTSRDSFDALFLLLNMAEILVIVGEQEQAIGQIQYMLSLPGFVSKPYFKVDPLWRSLEAQPEYRKLIYGSSS
ncbi:MAG: protein kinase [candidate division Zixibacteria bacterium]|nr:protein kinase [candidate division Zixibacteria bacterium]